MKFDVQLQKSGGNLSKLMEERSKNLEE